MATKKVTKVRGLTATQKIKLMSALLTDLQKKRYHEPDSDSYEYCAGCQRSPYNVPPHDPGCFVVRIHEVLRACGIKFDPWGRRG